MEDSVSIYIVIAGLAFVAVCTSAYCVYDRTRKLDAWDKRLAAWADSPLKWEDDLSAKTNEELHEKMARGQPKDTSVIVSSDGDASC